MQSYLLKNTREDLKTIAEFFYYVKYGSSTTYNVKENHQLISVMKTHTGVFVVFKTKLELECQNELFLEVKPAYKSWDPL